MSHRVIRLEKYRKILVVGLPEPAADDVQGRELRQDMERRGALFLSPEQASDEKILTEDIEFIVINSLAITAEQKREIERALTRKVVVRAPLYMPMAERILEFLDQKLDVPAIISVPDSGSDLAFIDQRIPNGTDYEPQMLASKIQKEAHETGLRLNRQEIYIYLCRVKNRRTKESKKPDPPARESVVKTVAPKVPQAEKTAGRRGGRKGPSYYQYVLQNYRPIDREDISKLAERIWKKAVSSEFPDAELETTKGYVSSIFHRNLVAEKK